MIVITVGLLLLLSTMASKLTERSGIPVLLVFLSIGMLAGSEGPGGIHFENATIANLFGTFALSYILFSGGLGTHWRSVRPVLWRSTVLSTLGVAVTAGLVGLFSVFILSIPLLEALLIGAIVSSTDAAAVFSVLRSRGVMLKGNLKALLEMESGSNDPMAVFLTMSLMRLLMEPIASWLQILPSFFINMTLGIAAGIVLGKVAVLVLDGIHLQHEGLYPVLSMSLVLIAFGVSELIHGNGFLAVYACGLVVGNSDFTYKRSIEKFHDGLGWLMQISMFLILGLLVFPSRMLPVAISALLVSGFLMFVARPVAVYLGLFGSGFSVRERTLVAWTGLRGAVPIVLATFPFIAGYAHADRIFHLVFFVVLTSVLLQGTTLMPVARFLGVDEPLAAKPRYPLEFEKTSHARTETREIDILPNSVSVGRQIAELNLPAGALILLVRRENDFLIPRGETQIEPFDTLLVMAEKHALCNVREILTGECPDSERPKV
mgnify:CR=1 FL=1|jgi:cell volume regulation protein A